MLKESILFGMASKFVEAIRHLLKIMAINGKVKVMLLQILLGELPSLFYLNMLNTFGWKINFLVCKKRGIPFIWSLLHISIKIVVQWDVGGIG